MIYQLSPGQVVQEYDLTPTIQGVSTTTGAIVVNAAWGPIDELVTTDGTDTYVARFFTPNSNTFVSHLVAENFLSYSSDLVVARANYYSNNAAANSSTGIRIKNYNDYTENWYNGQGNAGSFVAKYPGALGNSIRVSICPSANAFSSNHSLTATTTAGNNQIVFSAALSTDTKRIPVAGDYINVGGQTGNLLVTNVTGNVVTVNTAPTLNLSANSATSSWYYASQFPDSPATTSWTASRGGSGDELHVIVVDNDGKISGLPGTVLEKYAFLSKAKDAFDDSGSSLYYRDVILNKSNWIYWTDHLVAGINWGNTAVNTAFTIVNQVEYDQLTGGTDVDPTDADKIAAWSKFINKEAVDVSLLITADASTTVSSYVIQNVAQPRMDCVAFVSPQRSDVVQVPGQEVNNILATRNNLPSSSYAFMDNNWKLQFDRYNNVNRWVPLNGDIAGLAARTDYTRDPWYSIAGYSRGQILNVVKLAWQASKTDRDNLYVKGINAVISPDSEGTILFGDKTLLNRPSAFSRINVRRLFITLEKAISNASKYSLFEFNDRFTRAQFVALVEPFLRDVQGRRGIYDYKVVCDESNNTPDVIDRSEFVGDIYIKPARSINYITLRFVAVATGADFSEVVGQAF